MTEAAKSKRPVPPQFLKKKELQPANKVKTQDSKEPALCEEIAVLSESLPEAAPEQQKNFDMTGLIRDLMFNKYFHIMEKEAKPIAEKMVSEGSEALHGIKWFLAYSERVQLAKELAQKYNLS